MELGYEARDAAASGQSNCFIFLYTGVASAPERRGDAVNFFRVSVASSVFYYIPCGSFSS